MSSITPPSYIDDGRSVTKRILYGLHPQHVAHWINNTGSYTSAYTGSFFDDGADLLHPPSTTPGFGQVNPDFYKQRESRERKDGAWNADMQRAISGDIYRNLAKIKGRGGLEVKRQGEMLGVRGKKWETVTIPMPRKWAPFIIKAENGRVIVVDEDGEFDSGPQTSQQDHKGTRWVRAASSIEPLSTAMPMTRMSWECHCSSHNPKQRPCKESKKQTLGHEYCVSPVLEALPSIPETEVEVGWQQSGGEEVAPPTDFFMAGGASGWPSGKSTSLASWTVSAISHGQFPSTVSASDSSSPVRSPPGGWPSPPHSLTKGVETSQHSWTDEDHDSVSEKVEWQASRKGESSQHSHRTDMLDRRTRRGFGNGSTITQSTYVVPTVDDAAESSSNSITGFKETGWDGYERDKTSSEVSVVGTSSGRTSIGSEASDRYSVRAPSHRGHRSRKSHRDSDYGSQAGWSDSRAGQQSWSSQTARGDKASSRNQGDWRDSNKSRTSEARGSRYANGYDEDNETYLNENWGGTPVRVGSRRLSVAGQSSLSDMLAKWA